VEITEIRVHLLECRGDTGKLRAYASLVFDGELVVKDMRVVETAAGPIVAFPSRKVTAHCPTCAHRNPLAANFCGHCGGRLPGVPGGEPEAKLYVDTSHPITAPFGSYVRSAVLAAYRAELAARAADPAGPDDLPVIRSIYA
jgi:stage V sporulation protein G